MKAVILAGGAGTRLMEETTTIPKPMVEIGGMPIIWHIMKIYSQYGIDDFVILAGYKGYHIKDYFANYYLRRCDVTFDLSSGEKLVHHNVSEPWKVTIVDTGMQSMTGGRLLRARKHLEGERFFLTYGDGVSNVNLRSLLEFHKSKKAVVTMTAVKSDSRYGYPSIDSRGMVTRFAEKPEGLHDSINAGFFVVEPEVFAHFHEGDATVFERRPLESLAQQGKLAAFHHDGFWKCMDTLRDKVALEEAWASGKAPWKTWSEDAL